MGSRVVRVQRFRGLCGQSDKLKARMTEPRGARAEGQTSGRSARSCAVFRCEHMADLDFQQDLEWIEFRRAHLAILYCNRETTPRLSQDKKTGWCEISADRVRLNCILDYLVKGHCCFKFGRLQNANAVI